MSPLFRSIHEQYSFSKSLQGQLALLDVSECYDEQDGGNRYAGNTIGEATAVVVIVRLCHQTSVKSPFHWFLLSVTRDFLESGIQARTAFSHFQFSTDTEDTKILYFLILNALGHHHRYNNERQEMKPS